MPLHRAPRAALAAALVLALGACSEEVAPAVSDGRPFTLWGQLDPTRPRQLLRVAPITPTLDPEPDRLDAAVTLVDLRTGAETPWRDSLVTFPDGSRGHVFVADVRPEYGATYRVRARRSDGAEATAVVTVPDRAAPAFEDSGPDGTLDLVVAGAPRVVGARVVYRVTTGRGTYDEAIPLTSGVQSVEYGWRLRADLRQHEQELERRAGRRDEGPYTVTGVRFAGAVANAEWAPPYPLAFSRDLLLQPGAVSNVQNGYGFVGAAYPFDEVWSTDRGRIRDVGL